MGIVDTVFIFCTVQLQELIYVWNGFMIIGKKPALIEPILTKVEATLNEINAKRGEDITHYYEIDNVHINNVQISYYIPLMKI